MNQLDSYNSIEIASGSLNAKGSLSFGELFYDDSKQDLYIGTSEIPTPDSYSRIGGFSSIVFKGVFSGDTYEELEERAIEDGYQPGDAYLCLTSFREDYVLFTAGQVIVWTGDDRIIDQECWLEENAEGDISSRGVISQPIFIPGAYHGWICLSTGALGGDGVIDYKNIPTALEPREGLGPTPEWPTTTTVKHFKDAFKMLLNTRCVYIGPTENITLLENENYERIEDVINLRKGEWTIYCGDTVNLNISGSKEKLYKGSAIYNQNGKISIVPMGTFDIDDLNYKGGNSGIFADYKESNYDLTKAGDAIDCLSDHLAGLNNRINIIESSVKKLDCGTWL